MECQSSDSKRLFKVFDASKCKRSRKKREGLDETNSGATDDSNSGCQANICRISSVKASLQNISPTQTVDMLQGSTDIKRDVSSVSMTRPSADTHRPSRSPRRHRRLQREGMSLALKAGMVSTPRSISGPEADVAIESIPRDQDSFIYAFLEEAIKRDKKKQRHRRHERRESRDRDASVTREHRHHRKRRDDVPSREHEKPTKDVSPTPALDQSALLETFAKLCVQMNENNKNYKYANEPPMPRTLSHKSLQCEPISRKESYNIDRCPDRARCSERSREDVDPSRIRSQDNFHCRQRSKDKIEDGKDRCVCYNAETPKYSSKLDMTKSRIYRDERYGGYREKSQPRCSDHYRKPERDYRDYDRRNDEDRRKIFEQKASRSFEVNRDKYEDDRYRRTARSDRRYDEREKKYDDKEKYYDDRIYDRDKYNKDRKSKKNLERFDRNSIASREDDFRDRYSEKERDSGLSVADEISTVSGRSNYLRVVKQEISEQREAMDKMMKLWKELMRCFKGMSQTQAQDNAVNESGGNGPESAAAQLRLWRECMRRYETVARDVGDTDARLMEEINKQRSEMAEMANMWQECLQRYRDISTDFKSLKQQLSTSESPSRIPAGAPVSCAEGEGEGSPPVGPYPSYRVPHNYPQMVPMGAFPNGGSPLRSRGSAPGPGPAPAPAPPAWWWGADRPRDDHRRRSSPDSRGSRDRDRDRDRRHRHKDRDEPRYKEKPSKPSAARSEHRHRKR